MTAVSTTLVQRSHVTPTQLYLTVQQVTKQRYTQALLATSYKRK